MTPEDLQHAEERPSRQGPLLWIIALTGCALGAASILQSNFLPDDSSNDRYYIVQDKNGIVTEIDRKTGRTWRIYRSRKHEIRNIEDAETLPESLKNQVSIAFGSKATYPYNILLDVYNGTTWTISEITIRVSNAANRRLYRQATTIEPQSSGDLRTNVHPSDEDQTAWSLVEVRGYPPSDSD